MQGPHSVTHAQRAGLLTEMVPCRIRTELRQSSAYTSGR